MVHLIDDEFKLREILIFAKPFSDISHSAWEIEKAIKKGLTSYGIGKYDLMTTPVIDTVRIFVSVALYGATVVDIDYLLGACFRLDVVNAPYIYVLFYFYRSVPLYKGLSQTKQAPWLEH